MDLSHLKVLVTGAGGTGVGAGICQALDQFGATLIINDIDPDKAEKAAQGYTHAIAIPADISNREDLILLFDQIQAKVGPINGLVNNAGIGLSKNTHEVEGPEFDRLYQVDVRAVWEVSKHFIQQLLDHNLSGNIVNISSVHAFASQPKYAIYASAKAAVEGLTRGMAYEYGKYNIRCNAIGPGMVQSEQNYDIIKTWTDDPEQWEREFVADQQVLHHFIQPIDCGYTAAFLLSELSRSITGQTIYVDAGKTIMLFNKAFIEPKHT
ncbi:MAG: SDR family oxidoreductase [Saprospiraceae bacterium]